MKNAKSRSETQGPTDIAIVAGPTEDRQGARIVRIREGVVSAGEIRPAKEGEPITHHEVVRLRPLDAERRVCAVEVVHAPESQRASERSGPAPQKSSRPARVSTESYRKNWSAIFDSKRTRRAKSDWTVN